MVLCKHVLIKAALLKHHHMPSTAANRATTHSSRKRPITCLQKQAYATAAHTAYQPCTSCKGRCINAALWQQHQHQQNCQHHQLTLPTPGTDRWDAICYHAHLLQHLHVFDTHVCCFASAAGRGVLLSRSTQCHASMLKPQPPYSRFGVQGFLYPSTLKPPYRAHSCKRHPTPSKPPQKHTAAPKRDLMLLYGCVAACCCCSASGL